MGFTSRQFPLGIMELRLGIMPVVQIGKKNTLADVAITGFTNVVCAKTK